jgi:hypothetical protein
MRQVDDPESPFDNMVPSPPVLGAQLECIMYSRFLRPLGTRIIRDLMSMIESKQLRYWYTIYLVLFLMLHSCAMMTQRDMDFAARTSLRVSYLAFMTRSQGQGLPSLTLVSTDAVCQP